MPTAPFRPARLPRRIFPATLALFLTVVFCAACMAVLLGWLPVQTLIGDLDFAVGLLAIPFCALVFGIIAEVIRTGLGPSGPHARRLHAPLDDWWPGKNQG